MSHICITCGTQYPPSDTAPANCPICQDERQYVRPQGQGWTSLAELQKDYHNDFFEEGEHLWGIHTQPQFAIGQRALLVQNDRGNVLWDCVSLIDEQTIENVKSRGGLSAIAISHPHYYTSMVEWSRAFGGVPIYLHEDDRQWVQFQDPAIKFWNGETKVIGAGLTLIRVGAHFKGFQVLHDASGSGTLMTGDMPQVCPDRRYVSFMYSYPNYIPVDATTVRSIVSQLKPYAFTKLHGAWPRFDVLRDPKAAIQRSAERYLRAIGDHDPL